MITVRTTRSNGIKNQILSIKDILDGIEIEGEDGVELNFEHYSFTPPLLSVFFAQLQAYANVRFTGIRDNSYFRHINFPNGMIVDDEESLPVIERYKSKNYLPIIKFDCATDRESSSIREKVLTQINQTIKRISNVPTNYFSAISYFISELTDNIVSHSKVQCGWLSFQYYPGGNYIDLCIADSGVGILNAYKESGIDRLSGISTDAEAIQSAMDGNSIKNDIERGFGLHTSRNMLVDGLGGSFMLWTGGAILTNNTIINIGTSFDGVLILVRIPCNNISSAFNMLNFVG